MYNDIFLGPNKDLRENIRETLIKRCPNAISPRLSDKECSNRMTELMLSIYYSLLDNGEIELNTKRKKQINTEIRNVMKKYGAPSKLNLRRKYLIEELLVGLQGGYYGTIFQGPLANNILESITT